MNVTLIMAIVIIVLGGIAYYGWKRSSNLKKELVQTKHELSSIVKNIETIRLANKDDAQAQTKLLAIDKEIINAKTPMDASRIRRNFVANAYGGM